MGKAGGGMTALRYVVMEVPTIGAAVSRAGLRGTMTSELRH